MVIFKNINFDINNKKYIFFDNIENFHLQVNIQYFYTKRFDFFNLDFCVFLFKLMGIYDKKNLKWETSVDNSKRNKNLFSNAPLVLKKNFYISHFLSLIFHLVFSINKRSKKPIFLKNAGDKDFSFDINFFTPKNPPLYPIKFENVKHLPIFFTDFKSMGLKDIYFKNFRKFLVKKYYYNF